MTELVFQRRGEELMRVALDRTRTTVGRGGDSDVALPEPTISESQFSILRRGNRYVLVDASGRGTVVDGEKRTELQLHDGASIELGACLAVFRVTSALGVAEAEGPKTEQRAPSNESDLEGRFQLRIRSGGREQTVMLTGDKLSLGKDGENELVLDDRFVSSFHAQLARTRRGFWIHDLGSTNGTFLNGSRIREAEVAPGSLLRLGETEISLERSGRTPSTPDAIEGLVGRDPAFLQVLDLIDRVAPSNVAVAIFGETGTGKELVAHALHERSLRRSRPFVPVNCAALHRELVESELFGHEKGAFTGADRARAGAFEEASTGTLFLDEVGELSSDLQAKLLRVLESGEVRRLGSSKTSVVDVRIVAATHVDLLPLVRKGAFREDLYYRLCVFPLTVPPLRRRPLDLMALAEHFLLAHAPVGLALHFTEGARAKLASHPFPGNVRELRNLVQRALVLRSGREILPADISFDAPYREPAPGVGDPTEGDEWLRLPGRTLTSIIDEARRRAIRRHGGNKNRAAKELGVARSTLTRLSPAE